METLTAIVNCLWINGAVRLATKPTKRHTINEKHTAIIDWIRFAHNSNRLRYLDGLVSNYI
jgi:hypothetical protein